MDQPRPHGQGDTAAACPGDRRPDPSRNGRPGLRCRVPVLALPWRAGAAHGTERHPRPPRTPRNSPSPAAPSRPSGRPPAQVLVGVGERRGGRSGEREQRQESAEEQRGHGRHGPGCPGTSGGAGGASCDHRARPPRSCDRRHVRARRSRDAPPPPFPPPRGDIATPPCRLIATSPHRRTPDPRAAVRPTEVQGASARGAHCQWIGVSRSVSCGGQQRLRDRSDS